MNEQKVSTIFNNICETVEILFSRIWHFDRHILVFYKEYNDYIF